MWFIRQYIWLISRLTVAFVLVGFVYWYVFTPGSYEREFQRSAEALKHVRTFKFSELRDSNPSVYREGTYEVDCAVGYHGTTHLHQQFTDKAADDQVREEAKRFKGANLRKASDGQWERDNDGSGYLNAGSVCDFLAAGKPRGPFPDYEELHRRYVITKKGVKEVSGVKCREWNAKLPHQPGTYGGELTICIGVDDHLPYEIYSPDLGPLANTWPHYIFRDYNVPVEIPNPVLQEVKRPDPYNSYSGGYQYGYRNDSGATAGADTNDIKKMTSGLTGSSSDSDSDNRRKDNKDNDDDDDCCSR